ncbi:insulin-like protein growth factor 2 mRNA-binding protein 1-like protein [Sarcoptes scabiei]|uniref:Insulin-like protein growth factor 2 mRNA-binding protein 1-like protein n=1 Tax=Sarcoptes scabiei TaxID=52283 RepID=A0A131ZYP3_SARSC|nr:insulin-like protein growth factor 2 mRNA-binding protein 1-like protein [Sarcoptes scabiei]
MDPLGEGKIRDTSLANIGATSQSNGSAPSSSSTSSISRANQNGSKHRSNRGTNSSSSISLSSPTALSSTSASSSSLNRFRFSTTLPLRLLVLKDLVGAIIGRGGGTIRQITQETHARVDVHRKESSTANENVIMIYGYPENCSEACRRILEVMQQEAKSLNKPNEIVLKILASNSSIGRIIGKGGNTIRRIMQQTDTKITITNANLTLLERIISISGQLDNMCKAEVMISEKLRECFERDLQLQYQQSIFHRGFPSSIPPLLSPGQTESLGLTSNYMTGSLHGQQALPIPLGTSPSCAILPSSALVGRSPASVLAPSGNSVSSLSSGTGTTSHSVPPTPTQASSAALYNPYGLTFMYPPHSQGHTNISTHFGSGPSSASYMNFMNPMLSSMDNIKETVTIFIPNSVVGAIIGRGGSTIREMMSISGAVIKVAQQNEEDPGSSSATSSGDGTAQGSGSSNKSSERRVTINGNSFAQSQAQFFVFQKVFTELTNQSSMLSTNVYPYCDPSVLKIEILVPTNQVRRIIGKGGSVITDLQRTSGATIKLSKEHHQSSSTGTQPTASSSTKPQTSREDSPATTTTTATTTTLTAPNGAELTARTETKTKASGSDDQTTLPTTNLSANK